MGKGYIVGAGPGDIGLITVKGLDLIKIADVILYDRLIDTKLLNNAKKNCELIYVGKSSTTGGETQKEINNLFLEKTKINNIVVRLHGGDPFLFGRGSEEIDLLVEEGLEYEVVPGISSSFAVPTYAGIPVTKRDISSSLHIFTARSGGGDIGLDFNTIAQIKGTIVILMGVGVIKEISNSLINRGMSKDTAVSVIQEGTTSNQKGITGTLENIADLVNLNGIKAPSIIVIGGTAKLLGQYDWFSKRKLFGRKIILTRDIDSYSRSSKFFEKEGAKVIALPMIELKTNFSRFDDDFLEQIKNSEIISFNSPKAVNSFFEGLNYIGKDLRVLGNKKIACIGSGTVETLETFYIKPDYVPKEYSVKTLLSELKEFYGKNRKVLLLSSDIHGRSEKDLSKEFNLQIKIKDIYINSEKTYEKELLEKELKDKAYIVFLSSSAVESFAENTKDIDISNLKIVSIGPMTSKSFEKFGYKVDVEAKTYSLEGIVEELINKLGVVYD